MCNSYSYDLLEKLYVLLNNNNVCNQGLPLSFKKHSLRDFVSLHQAAGEAGLQCRSIGLYKTVAALPRHTRFVNQRVVKLKDLGQMFFIRMSETSYTGHRRWLTETCRRVGFTPRVLEDVEIERAIIKSVAAGLGIALGPDQIRKVPHSERGIPASHSDGHNRVLHRLERR